MNLGCPQCAQNLSVHLRFGWPLQIFKFEAGIIHNHRAWSSRRDLSTKEFEDDFRLQIPAGSHPMPDTDSLLSHSNLPRRCSHGPK